MGLVVALAACGITGEGKGRRVATSTPPKVSKESVTVATRALPNLATQAPTRPTKKGLSDSPESKRGGSNELKNEIR